VNWRWIDLELVLAVHDRQLSEHGGLAGVRDLPAVEAALAHPRNLLAYGTPDAADLAAAYVYGLARNHGFADGNKRTAWVIARVFLADNQVRLTFEKAAAVRIMECVAAGAVTERDLAEWFRARIAQDDAEQDAVDGRPM
jgi:death-on-curing protein